MCTVPQEAHEQAVPLRSFNAAPVTQDGQTHGNLVMLDADAHRIQNVVVRPPEDVSGLQLEELKKNTCPFSFAVLQTMFA